MSDYPVTEMLTRTLVLERLKELSNLYLAAAMDFDSATMRMLDEERRFLRDEYLKVIK